jgi:hypothetical protein
LLHRRLDDLSEKGGLAASAGADDLGEPSSWESAPQERRVELLNSGPEPRHLGSRGRKERAERGRGERHERVGFSTDRGSKLSRR